VPLLSEAHLDHRVSLLTISDLLVPLVHQGTLEVLD
jgi:hypothetical protein